MSSNSGQAQSVLDGKRLAIIGIGNMGGAIAHGIVQSGAIAPSNLFLYDADPAKLQPYAGRAILASSAVDAASQASVILLAVKPAILKDALSEIAKALDSSKLIVSIAAGKTIKTLESLVAAHVRVIRAMPNTPALVLEGATAIARGSHATDADAQVALAIFGSVGQVVEVGETLMDAVTGLSGSGPAYVFTIIEALTDGGVLQGLPRETARTLAAQTLLGAAKMALGSAEHVATLRDMVTTPGGTTIHGLAALEAQGVRAAFIEAVAAATERSRELG